MKVPNKHDNPLSNKQKKAALYLALGLKRTEITKKLKITRETLWRWRKLERFQKRYLKHCKQFDQHVDTFLEKRLKYMMEEGCEAIMSLLHSGNGRSVRDGVELLFQLNNRLQRGNHVTGQIKHQHDGSIDLNNQGTILIKKKKLKNKEKKNIMKLLDKTRHLMPSNSNLISNN